MQTLLGWLLVYLKKGTYREGIMGRPKGIKSRNPEQMKLRRMKMMESRLDGLSYQAIADKNKTAKSLVHREVQKALVEMAGEYSEEADKLRAIQMVRYEKLLASYFKDAVNGDREGVNLVLNIMSHMNKINGLEQRAIEIDQKVVEFTFNIERADVGNLPNNIQASLPVSEAEGSNIQ